MTNDAGYDPDSPDAIKAEIEHTRYQMSNKIDTLQERLHPDNLKHQAQQALQNAIQESADSIKSYVQENTMEIRNAVIDSFKQNPIPTALVGLGLGWILLESLSGRDKGDAGRAAWQWASDDYSYGSAQGYGRDFAGETGRVYGGYAAGGPYDYSRDARSSGSFGGQYGDTGGNREASRTISHKVGDKVQELGSTVKDKTSQAVEQVQGTAEQLVNQVSDKTHQLGQQAVQIREQTGQQMQQAYHVIEENPLAVGAAALALGAVIGLLLPATRHENQMVGDLRDQLVEKGKAVAGDVTQRVKEVVEEVKPELQQMGSRVVEELRPEVEQLGQKVAGDLKQTGEQALRTVTDSSGDKVASSTVTAGDEVRN